MTDKLKNVSRGFLNCYAQKLDITSNLKLMPQWIQKNLNGIIRKES